MPAIQTVLDYLRTRSLVDCDTLDVSIAEDLGPFVGCTSNQVIAFFEIQKPEHQHLIRECTALASELTTTTTRPEFAAVPTAELAVEIIMVKLVLRLLPYVTARIHIQTNPLYCHSTADTISNARRIIALVAEISPTTPSDRLSIKIPATHAGLRACAVLEKDGVRTLATTLFTVCQAVAAGAAGCTYIAPYVNALKVHFTPGFEDNTKVKGLKLCVVAQKYYRENGISTQVLPASLTSVAEILQLAGAQYITVPPTLLKALAAEPYNAANFVNTSLFDVLFDVSIPSPDDFPGLLDEDGSVFNAMVEDEDDGKMQQALDIFQQMQDGLIELVEKDLRAQA